MLRPSSESDCRLLAQRFAATVTADAERATAAMAVIAAPLRAGIQAGRAPRASQLAKAARSWAALP
jgi:hypothetical protein